MLDCSVCKNKILCKFLNTAEKLKLEVDALNEKYKQDFCGRIEVVCNYFVSDKLERTPFK